MFRSRRAKLRRVAQEVNEAKAFSGEGFSEHLVSVLEPDSPAAEAYRALRTNLLYAVVDAPPKVVMLTSHGPREGKSITCANLGVSLVQADKSVLIMDCDFHKPVLHRIFGLRNLHGVTNIIAGEYDLQEVWQEPRLPGLKVLTVGPIPPNPAELLSSRRFAEFLGGVRKEFDYVLIDTPPVGLISDPVVLATQSDGVLFVLDTQSTRKRSLRQSMRTLEAVGANVLGTVMNNVEAPKGGYYYSSYRY